MADDPDEGGERTASDIADISRASEAGHDDGKDNDYNPSSEDTSDQKDAYNESWSKGHDEGPDED